MQAYVVILSAQPLFAEGIASRLQQYLHQTELQIVDPRQANAMAQIQAIRPSIVFLDMTDPEAVRLCPLSNLLLAFPALKIIRLDPQHKQIQVLTSRQYPAVKVRDLVELIEPSSYSVD